MDLRSYLDLAKRWLWLIALCALIAGLASGLSSRQQTKVYQAEALLLLDTSQATSNTPIYNDLVTSERLGRTYATLFASNQAVDEALERLGYRPAILGVSAEPQRDTALMRLYVQSDDAEAAAFMANTLPVVLTEQQRERQTVRYQQARENLTAELARVGSELTATRTEIDALDGDEEEEESSPALARLNADANLLQATYDTLLRNLATLELAETNSREIISIIEPAAAPTFPISPRPLNALMTALLLGALVGAAIVYLIEYLDDTIKSDSEIERLVGSGPLARVGRMGRTVRRLTIADLSMRDVNTEAYRILRTNIRFASVDTPLRRLMVTSPSPGDGKSTTAANLAMVMAQADIRTILLDGDLRRPAQHYIFNVPNRQGLTTALLEGEGAAERYLVPVKDQPNLRLLPSGPLPPNPSELLSSQRMHALLEELEGLADVVIVDTPPVLVVSDSSVLAREMSGVLLVLRAGKTTSKALESTVTQLNGVQAPLLGTVLNDLPAGQRGLYFQEYYLPAEDGSDDDGEGPATPPRGRGVRLPKPLFEWLQSRF